MRLLNSPQVLLPGLLALAALGIATESPSAQSSSNPACVGDDSGLKLPAGFCATVFADGIGHARHMVVAPSGVVYVNTWSGVYYGNDAPPAGGFLVALQDKARTGKASVIDRFGETVKSGGAGGTGIGIYKGSLYAEVNDRIVRYRLRPGAIVPSGPSETIVSGLPLSGDHPMHPFVIASDGSMYIDVASASNTCQEKNRSLKSPGAQPCTELETRGGVWRYDANKTNQTFSATGRYATGIRNAGSFTIGPAGRVFVTQHGRDQLHSNWPDLYQPDEEATLPAEEVLLLKARGDYGWPYCYYDPFAGGLVLAPEYGGDGRKTVGLCATKLPPVGVYPAHWAPNGIAYYDKRQFPARYRGGVFIAFHGSWNRAPHAQAGYNVAYQPLDGDRATGQCEIFADGFAGALRSPEKAAHRPSGVAVSPDGTLYVSDDLRGRIYRIVYRGGPGTGDAAFTPCPSPTEPAGPVIESPSKPPEGTQPDVTVPVPEGATAEIVALGERIYRGQVGKATCTGCHGDSGQGSPLGPPLTGQKWWWSDGSWAGIAKSIADGIPQPKNYRSPMPANGGAELTADEVSALAAYVWSLSHRGTTGSSGQAALPAKIANPGQRIHTESLTSTADGTIIRSSGHRVRP